MGLEPIFRVARLREIEAANAAAPLMERAGLAAATLARELLGDRAPRALVLAGPGNNGGDGFVVARLLKDWFFDVMVAFCGDAAHLSRDAAAARQAWSDAGGETLTAWPERDDWGLIVDALFGIGLARPAQGVAAQWIERANASGVAILAVDLPSGLNADTGVAYAPAIRAEATATFIALKPGLLTAEGPDHCGRLSVHRLDIDLDAVAVGAGRRLDWPALAATLPAPLRRARRNVHKGTFGTLGIVGGSDGFVGAAILAGRAALHLGAGKLWIGLAASERPALDWVQPELMLRAARDVLADKPDALVVGPGLGTSARGGELLAQALALPCPLAIDADALNLIATDKVLASAAAARTAPTLMTPHPAEAARVSGTSRIACSARSISPRASIPASCSRAREACSRTPTEAGRSMRPATRRSRAAAPATCSPACSARSSLRAWMPRKRSSSRCACTGRPRTLTWQEAAVPPASPHRSSSPRRDGCSTRPRSAKRGADQGSSSVEPVVLRDSRSRCARAASLSG
jgi:hydroxyethylthiazole kinase-like uncharacterized protein yjeF